MKPIEIARRLVELERTEEALRAYTLAIHQREDNQPEDELEAALFLLRFGGDYKVAYTSFVRLYNKGLFQDLILGVMMDSFYKPNEKLMKSRYEKNCKRLAKYKYCFKKDFLPFEQLPVRFFPYDESSYIPFYVAQNRFGDHVDLEDPVITRNFFADLEKPIFASDVYSQYELSYLRDNVRRSDWVARENHVYLHYSDFSVFCSYLQILKLRPLLEEEKLVFLMEEEKELYPIDFKARFGLDYSQCTPKPISIREVTRLLHSSQLSSHNGGDFFNEVFDYHPNLIFTTSMFLDGEGGILSSVDKIMELCASAKVESAGLQIDGIDMVDEFFTLKNLTKKDTLVAMLMSRQKERVDAMRTERIAPVLYLQPHFSNIVFDMSIDEKGRTELHSDQLERLQKSDMIQGFKYIKTFSPLRRMTTSHAASLRYAVLAKEEGKKEENQVIMDVICQRVLGRSYLIDPRERLFRDSVAVRFEDGKLNPKATFTALAEFCDLPYTESMTYCSDNGKRDPQAFKGNDIGFSTAAVYRVYENYINNSEGYYIEYFMRDAYEAYGYDFHYYDGAPVDEAAVEKLVDHFDCCDGYLYESWKRFFLAKEWSVNGKAMSQEQLEEKIELIMKKRMELFRENRLILGRNLLRGLYFISKDSQPLKMLPLLQPKEEFLENPLYK